MKNKDTYLLEEAYLKILNASRLIKENEEAPEEADYDEYTHSGVPYDPSVHGDLPIGNASSEPTPEHIDISGLKQFDREIHLSNFLRNPPHEGVIKNYDQLIKFKFNGRHFTKMDIVNPTGDGSYIDLEHINRTLDGKHGGLNSPLITLGRVVSSSITGPYDQEGGEDNFIDAAYEDRYPQHESVKIPHGLQPIMEAKKKKKAVSAKKNLNPWAIENALEKKTSKHFSKAKKEKIVKGIKKGAKKYGKKITSKSLKKNS